jgi:[acyl-carrier-protein] S-malonyltransferase
MAALATDTAVAAALAVGRAHGPLGLAARNAPDEWVISGSEAAVVAALRAVPGRRLQVAGAWHSPAMAPALEPFRTAARALPRRPTRCLLLSGVSGAAVEDPAAFPDLLAEALLAPVRFTELLAEAARRGVTDVVVLGPHRVARGLVRRSLGAIPVHLVSEPGDAARVAEALA